MKYALLFILSLFLIPQYSVAQSEWAPIGTEWHYGYWDLNNAPYGYGYFYYKVEKDTVYQNQQCRYISVIDKRSNGEEIAHELFTYEQNDSVFMALEVEDTFRLMMDYGLAVGDTIELAGIYYPESGFYVLDEISDVQFEDVTLKKWSLKFVNGNLGCKVFMEYYEHFGHLYGIMNNQQGCVVTEFLRAELRCYNADSIFIDNRPFGDCNLWGGVLNTEEALKTLIQVYPNPVSDKLFIEFSELQEASRYEIFDNLGKRVKTGMLNAQSHVLNVANLSSGIYWIVFSDESASHYSRKFIKI